MRCIRSTTAPPPGSVPSSGQEVRVVRGEKREFEFNPEENLIWLSIGALARSLFRPAAAAQTPLRQVASVRHDDDR